MIDIVGTETGENGRSCNAHKVYGMQLDPGSKVRIRKETVISPTMGDEEDCLVAYGVGNGARLAICLGILPFVAQTIMMECTLPWSRCIHLDHLT